MRKFGNILWGIAFIAIGLIWALNAVGITDISIFFKGWWTLFIIIPCGIGLLTEREKTGNLIGLAIGIALLLASHDVIYFGTLFRLIVPFILICIGLSIIFKDTINKKVHNQIRKLNKQELEERYATFSGENIDMTDEEFKGLSVNAIFGGIDLDIRNSKINGDQVINASAIFGGIDIDVPTNVNVKVKSTSIFGGVGNKIPKHKSEDMPTIYVNAFCLFGGVGIK